MGGAVAVVLVEGEVLELVVSVVGSLLVILSLGVVDGILEQSPE